MVHTTCWPSSCRWMKRRRTRSGEDVVPRTRDRQFAPSEDVGAPSIHRGLPLAAHLICRMRLHSPSVPRCRNFCAPSDVESLAGHRLPPMAFLAFWRMRSEVNRCRSVVAQSSCCGVATGRTSLCRVLSGASLLPCQSVPWVRSRDRLTRRRFFDLVLVAHVVVTGERLAGLELRAGLGVVKHNRHEILGWSIFRGCSTDRSCFRSNSRRWRPGSPKRIATPCQSTSTSLRAC